MVKKKNLHQLIVLFDRGTPKVREESTLPCKTTKPRKLEKNLPSPVLVTGNRIQSMHIAMITIMIVSKMMMIQIMIKRIIKIRMIM